MNKLLKYSLAGLVAILIIGFLGATFFLDSIVKSGIEDVGSDMAGTQVTVENVSVSPFSGSGTVDGLKVDNPDGFESEHAIVLQSIDISMDVTSVFSDEILVDEIAIKEPAISVIQKVPENNLRMLMKNFNETMAEESASSSTMIIDHLVVQNGQVTVTPSIGGTKSATVKMDKLELRNVGKEGSNSTEQVVNQVASAVINEALKKAVSGELENLKDKAKDAVEDIFN